MSLVSDSENPATTLQTGVRELVRDFSIEMLPREVELTKDLLELLKPGTNVYLTRLPKGQFADTLRAAKRLRSLGFRPVPHMTARTTASAKELFDQVDAYAGEAGVDEILVVAGSQAWPVGPFENTMQMLESGAFERAGIRRIGVAGHPEGLLHFDEAQLDAAILEKNAFMQASGTALYLVTQFFFDAAPVIAWERRIRLAGNRMPVHVGLHGLTGTAGLFKHAVACGIGASIKVLGQHTNMLQLAVVRSPERLVVAIARAKAADGDSTFARVHFFPFGAFARTATWANAVADGRFVLAADDSIVIEP